MSIRCEKSYRFDFFFKQLQKFINFFLIFKNKSHLILIKVFYTLGLIVLDSLLKFCIFSRDVLILIKKNIF